MASDDELVATLIRNVPDYRVDAVVNFDENHINQWLSQFPGGDRRLLLEELCHITSKTYFSIPQVTLFLSHMLESPKLIKGDPKEFWLETKFLDIQARGASQREMLAMMSRILTRKYGLTVDDCGQTRPARYVYLDDAMFTGQHVSSDLCSWLDDSAPGEIELHVLLIATHEGAYYYRNRVLEKADQVGKKLTVKWWNFLNLENRLKYSKISDVTWPTELPDDGRVAAYVGAFTHAVKFREPGGSSEKGVFSGEAGRSHFERVMLSAGCEVKEKCPLLPANIRPLGHSSLETLGFGSTIVTFRNCPNNAPTALWAGDPWYPLFPRKTNTATANERLFAMIDEALSQ